MAAPSFCLGSASPRRARLLEQLGYRFVIRAAEIDETRQPDEPAAAFVRRMALEKGRALLQREPSLPILTADTIVVLDGEVLGKPQDVSAAASMLNRLSGRQHRVLTAVALSRGNQPQRCFVHASSVTFAELEEADIQRYIATGEPMDKAGAYGIQGYAAAFVSHLDGSYSSVMGLPLHETAQLLKQEGIDWAPAGLVPEKY